MSMCVLVCLSVVCVRVCMCIYCVASVAASVYGMCVCLFACEWMHVCGCVCVCVCVSTRSCMRLRESVYGCVCLLLCLHACV